MLCFLLWKKRRGDNGLYSRIDYLSLHPHEETQERYKKLIKCLRNEGNGVDGNRGGEQKQKTIPLKKLTILMLSKVDSFAKVS